MLIRADISRREVVRPGEETWFSSPLPGVKRLMFDRDGGEVARATSLVRYAVGARFGAHVHDGGEEFLVLDGTFADEHGRYPAGTYVRNPPGSSHAPHSRTGCSLFVKLRQFDPEDRERVVIDTRQAAWYPGAAAGSSVMPLHHFRTERVALVRWAAGSRLEPNSHVGGEEILVLSGALEDEDGAYPAGTWLRNPPMSRHMPFSTQGCTILMKTGHLTMAAAA